MQWVRPFYSSPACSMHSRLPCYAFCICQQLNIRNTNQLSWAINYCIQCIVLNLPASNSVPSCKEETGESSFSKILLLPHYSWRVRGRSPFADGSDKSSDETIKTTFAFINAFPEGRWTQVSTVELKHFLQ